MADKNFSKIVKQDEQQMVSISLIDVDSTIASYMERHVIPEIEQNKSKVKVPLIYGNAERWKGAQKDGYLRDKLGKIQIPLIMFKRNSFAKNEAMRFLKDDKITYPTVRKFSQKNAYDRFSVLNPEFKKRYETFDVKMPDYVTVTYEVMVWTNFTEHNNKIIEQFQYFTDRYWGEDDKYKFKVLIDNFDNQQEVGAGTERIIRTTFTMSVNAYLLPKRADNIPTTQKGFTIRKVVVTNEVLLQGGDGYDSEGRPYLVSQQNIDTSNAYIYQEDENVLNISSLPITDESGNPIQL
jgi:hypothetical protein